MDKSKSESKSYLSFNEALTIQLETGEPMKSRLSKFDKSKANFPPPHRCLTPNGYYVSKSDLDNTTTKKIKKELLVQPQIAPAFSSGMPKKYKIYSETDYGFYLPRHYAYKLFDKPKYSNIKLGDSIEIKLKDGVKPLKFQEKSLTVLADTFSSNSTGTGGILSLPCGWGKTFCAIWTITRVKRKALILVGKEFLAEQWEQAIANFTTSSKVGRVQGQRFDSDCDILIGMIQTVSMGKYKRSDFKDIGFLIVDECHHMSSEIFCRALNVVQPNFTLGLSATPKRKDGLSFVFHNFLGPLLHREERTTENRVKIIQTEIYSCSKYYETKYNGRGNVNSVEIASHLTNCSKRNELIIRILKILFKEKRKILLLSNRREHLHTLYSLLELENIEFKSENRPITFGLYYGAQGVSKKKHQLMLDESTKADLILGTDSIAKEGLDIPELNTLFLSTPAGLDVEQSVGRILRRVHQIEPLVIDLVDKAGNFKKHGATRAKWYRKQDYVVVKYKLDLEEYDVGDDPIFKFGTAFEKLIKSKSKSNSKSELESESSEKLEPLFDTSD